MSDYGSFGTLRLRRIVPPQRKVFTAPRGSGTIVLAAEALRALRSGVRGAGPRRAPGSGTRAA
jgi:hypothetical protein